MLQNIGLIAYSMINSAVTCSNPIHDGVGAQVLRQISIIALAHDRGFDYFHTPFTSVAHNDKNNPAWSQNWNLFFNLSHVMSASTSTSSINTSRMRSKAEYTKTSTSLPVASKKVPGNGRIFKRLLLEQLEHYADVMDIAIIERLYIQALGKIDVVTEKSMNLLQFATKEPSIFWQQFGDMYGGKVLLLLGLDPTPPTETQYAEWKKCRQQQEEQQIEQQMEQQIGGNRETKQTLITVSSSLTTSSTLFDLRDALSFCHNHSEAFLPILPLLRTAYFANDDKPSLCFQPHCLSVTRSIKSDGSTGAGTGTGNGTGNGTGKKSTGGGEKLLLSVAVHIRRGDIVKKHSKNGMIKRLVPCAHFAKVIAWLRTIDTLEEIGGKVRPIAWDVHIFSQGKMEEFTEITEIIHVDPENVLTFHLDEDVFETFHHLASADVLVMSRSDFSFVAGLLSNGIKLFCPPPFWHTAVPGWLECDRGGMFETDQFREKLSHISLLTSNNDSMIQ